MLSFRRRLIPIATAFVLFLPGAALAARGYATSDVNMHAGPGNEYPIVDRIPAGAHVNIHGCLGDYAWCDVSWRVDRGWVSANYLDYFYNNRYVYLPDYIDVIDVSIVTFSLGSYWSEYYTGRPWYHRRAHWRHFWHSRGRYGYRGGAHGHHNFVRNHNPSRIHSHERIGSKTHARTGSARQRHPTASRHRLTPRGSQVGAHSRKPHFAGHHRIQNRSNVQNRNPARFESRNRFRSLNHGPQNSGHRMSTGRQTVGVGSSAPQLHSHTHHGAPFGRRRQR